MLFAAQDVLELNRWPPESALDLTLEDSFDGARRPPTHFRIYRGREDSQESRVIVAFSHSDPAAESAPLYVSYLARLLADQDDVVDVVEKIELKEIPDKLHEPVLMSLRYPLEPELVEYMAPFVAQVCFTKRDSY
jgi:hypothetical protein